MSQKKSEDKEHGKKAAVDPTKPDTIKDKPYITREIETSVTLLQSPEENIVLESLLFLSKYADVKKTNLVFTHECGVLRKLLALFDHNICILRLSLRLLSKLLTVDPARLQIIEDEWNEDILKICNLYVNHADVSVKEFSAVILNEYSALGKLEVLLEEPLLVKAVLKSIKSPENIVILSNSLQLLNNLIESEEVRLSLPQEPHFDLGMFAAIMSTSQECFNILLEFFEKLTYFGEDGLQELVKKYKIVEHVLNIMFDPDNDEHVPTCLNILTHCMASDITSTYWVESIEFLRFCQWVKSCPDELMAVCANVLLQLAKIDEIRQMIYDLSVENTILSLLRSEVKQVLNVTCEALCFMSKHKYCCESIVTPTVLKKLLQILQRIGDKEDPQNETALTTLYYLSRRDSRTIYMIQSYDGVDTLVRYVKKGTEELSVIAYQRLLEMINMFVTNNQLQSFILSEDLFGIVLAQVQNESDEICLRSLEIMINCLNYVEFLDFFLLNRGSEMLIGKLSATTNENIVRMLAIFIHNAVINDRMADDLIHNKALLVLKQISDDIKYRIPLIQTDIHLIYDLCLPIKFFEIGRLDLLDKLTERFYVLTGRWLEPFPFLEVLELRQLCPISTVYVVDLCEELSPSKSLQFFEIHRQSSVSYGEITEESSATSLPSMNNKCSIQYGKLSHDPYLPKYFRKVWKLLRGVTTVEEKVQIIARFVDESLCGSDKNSTVPDKQHSFKLHIACLKQKLGTSLIPIGYLRLGFTCERALLFKTLADNANLPASFCRNRTKIYWNEVALIKTERGRTVLKMYVVDLMNNIGQLLPVGSRECNSYCDIQ